MPSDNRERSICGVSVGGRHPVRIMAVLNASPESFYSGSVRSGIAELVDTARRFVAEGADFLDIGAMSTAPYLDTAIPVEEERRRMVAAVAAVTAALDIPVSADSTRPEVAAAALAAGARIINDIGGLRTPGMGEMATRADAVVLMAAPGAGFHGSADRPIDRVRRDLSAVLARAYEAGVAAERIVIDPGIGFYTQTPWPVVDFNCAVLRDLASLDRFGHPILVGASRKSFIGVLTGRDDPEERLAGSIAAAALAVANGAAIIRTHDVAATRDAVRVARAIAAGAS